MNKKILVIDDDPVGTRLIEYILKQRGYQVLTAQNGLDGLKKAQDENPDLAVLNIMLPGMDGFEVCQRLRNQEKTAQLPILILSGRAQPADRATGFKMGADDYMTKPATPSEIISRIESLLSRNNVVNARSIVFFSNGHGIGATIAALNTAKALAGMQKRVIAVDLCPWHGSLAQMLGARPEDSFAMPENPVESLNVDDLESSLIAHSSGVRVLRIPEYQGKPERVPLAGINLIFNVLGNTTEYFIIDLPFQPAPLTRAMLAQGDFTVIVSGHTIEDLSGAKSALNILRFLGVPAERTGAIINDPNGACPAMVLPAFKPYIETALGIILLGITTYDSKAHEGSLPDSQSQATSEPQANPAQEIAQQLVALTKAPKQLAKMAAKSL